MARNKKQQHGPVRIPLLAEEINTAKRTVDGDSVTVQTSVDDKVEWVRETLIEEDVSFERVPIGRAVKKFPRIRQEDQVTIIPIVREVLFVEKRLMLVEELHIKRQQSARKVEKPVTLRRMTSKVTRKPAARK